MFPSGKNKEGKALEAGLLICWTLGIGLIFGLRAQRAGPNAIKRMATRFDKEFKSLPAMLRESKSAIPMISSLVRLTQKKELTAASSMLASASKTTPSIAKALEDDVESKNPFVAPILLQLEENIRLGRIGLLFPVTPKDIDDMNDSFAGNGEIKGMAITQSEKIGLEKPSLYLPENIPALFIHEATHLFAFLMANLPESALVQFKELIEEDLANLKGHDSNIEKIRTELNLTNSSMYTNDVLIGHEYLARLVQLSSHSELGPDAIKLLMPRSSGAILSVLKDFEIPTQKPAIR